MELRAFLVVAGSLWWLRGTTALAQPTGVTGYEAVSIGVPQGHFATDGRGVDDLGRVVGSSQAFDNTGHGVVWFNGEVIVLPPPQGAERAAASAISPTGGIIVGSSRVDSVSHAVAWVIGPRSIHVLDNLPGGPLTNCSTLGVNGLGWVVGSCSSPNRSTLWPALDPPIDLGNLGVGGGLELATDINELGEIVGTSRNTCGEERPYLWRNGEMIDIGGEPCYISGDAYGINNHTEIVGGIQGFGPFYWRDGEHTRLPSLATCGSLPRAINDLGVIAGESNPDPQCRNGQEHAVVWERVSSDFLLFDLNDCIPRHTDLTLREGNDINNAGQIAAFGEYDDGRERGFLVTPYLFEMSDPTPGRAGTQNTITVTGLQPNQRVLLAYGTREGAQKIRAGCPGGTLLIRDRQTSPIVRADANGVATITVNVPQSARGRTIRMQAIAPSECEVSHTATWTFE